MGDVQQLERLRTITISEIFGPTIEGEGDLIGTPTVFVRTGGCDFRCSWCDTLYAVLPEHRDEWTEMTPVAILDRVDELAGGTPILITLSGGNPALRPLEELLNLGHERHHTFTLETQGSVPQDWFALLDHLTISPKPPSSGMLTDWDKLRACILAASPMPDLGVPRTVSLKVVVFNDGDYDFARQVHQAFSHMPFFLSVGNEHVDMDTTKTGEQVDLLHANTDKLRWLMEKVAVDPDMRNARVLPQLHLLAWGNERGV